MGQHRRTSRAFGPVAAVVLAGAVGVLVLVACAAASAAVPTPAGADSGPGCGQRAVAAGRFDAACAEYQGYLDPGAAAGRAPTSGERQLQEACRQGWVPRAECP
jgi:hypothetical protein